MRTRQKVRISLAILVTVGFFAVVIYAIRMLENTEAIMLIIGGLTGSFSTVLGFYFTDSDKD